MGFKISYDKKDVTSGGIIEEGKYEATILTAEPKEWQGNYFLKFDIEIRSDVEQKYQGSKVMFNELQVSPGKVEFEEKRKKRVATFMHACGQVPGQDIDLEVLANDVVGKQVLVYIIHKEDKGGKKWPRVSFVAKSNVEPSPASTSSNKGPIEVKEDELPF